MELVHITLRNQGAVRRLSNKIVLTVQITWTNIAQDNVVKRVRLSL
jgi:hypothetical protein